MREIKASDARNRLGALLDMVEHGEEVVITRHGMRVARLIRETGLKNREQARLAAERIIINRRGKSLGELQIKDIINEGRA